MKVIWTSPLFARYDTTPISTLQQHGFELITLPAPADAPLSELEPHLAETVAMIVAFTDVNTALLALAPQLKIVCKHGVSVDNMDLNALPRNTAWSLSASINSPTAAISSPCICR